jgi:succinoglycan biosynthesis transport protein ExoP
MSSTSHPVRADDGAAEPESPLRGYLSVLRRRWLLVAIILIATPVCAYLITKSQTPQYESSADVVVGGPSSSTVAPGIGRSTDPARAAATQERLARLPAVARRVVENEGLAGETASDFLGRSNVTSDANADILTFSVRDSNAAKAVRLATAYAQAFTQYRREVESAAIGAARRDLKRQMQDLDRTGRGDTPLHASLAARDEQLAAAEVLPDLGAVVVQEATDSTQVSPHPTRNAALGIGLGILLMIGAAFFAEAIDTKVRSGDELEARLRRPVLGYLPAGADGSGKRRQLTMLAAPSSKDAEAVRMLRASFDYARLEAGMRSVMFSTFGAVDGKPAVAGNLAVALARSGRNVVLCDLDARSPSVAGIFGLNGGAGITDVTLNQARLTEALIPVPVRNGDSSSGGATAQLETLAGTLRVVPLGTLNPPSPAEFVGSRAVADVLGELSTGADVVLVEAPPILAVSDPIALSASVDGLVLVTTLHGLRRETLTAVERSLASFSAPLLGVVVLGAPEGV